MIDTYVTAWVGVTSDGYESLISSVSLRFAFRYQLAVLKF